MGPRSSSRSGFFRPLCAFVFAQVTHAAQCVDGSASQFTAWILTSIRYSKPRAHGPNNRSGDDTAASEGLAPIQPRWLLIITRAWKSLLRFSSRAITRELSKHEVPFMFGAFGGSRRYSLQWGGSNDFGHVPRTGAWTAFIGHVSPCTGGCAPLDSDVFGSAYPGASTVGVQAEMGAFVEAPLDSWPSRGGRKAAPSFAVSPPHVRAASEALPASYRTPVRSG
jgi:hypothetical protein